MNPNKIVLFGLLLYFNSLNAQFHESISPKQLYVLATDSNVYLHILVKDKLYQINHIKKEMAEKEMDYTIALFYENLNAIENELTDKDLLSQMKAIKEFWKKFEPYLTNDLTSNDFKKFHFEAYTFSKLLTNFSEKLFLKFNLNEKDWKNFNDIQSLKILVQKITFEYLAKTLQLNQSLTNQFIKDVNNFESLIKNKSNKFLNDILIGNKFLAVINEWNFFQRNLVHPKMKNVKTIFSLSLTMQNKLNTITSEFLKWDLL